MQLNDVSLSDVRLAVCDRGSGPVLLLVHGFPLNHSMWNAQIDHFATSCRVIAPDLRGFGESDVTTGTVSMEQYADDLAALLDALDIHEPVVLCGLSMGGYIAWQFWRKYADRLRGLVLCDTRAAADTPEAAEGRLEVAQRVVRDGAGFVAAAMLPKLLSEAARSSGSPVVDAVGKMILDTDPETIAAAQRGMAERPEMSGHLPEIQVPSLVIVGSHDAISPRDEMRSIAEQIPNCRFAEIPDAGHMAPMENAAAVNAAMQDYLATISR